MNSNFKKGLLATTSMLALSMAGSAMAADYTTDGVVDGSKVVTNDRSSVNAIGTDTLTFGGAHTFIVDQNDGAATNVVGHAEGTLQIDAGKTFGVTGVTGQTNALKAINISGTLDADGDINATNVTVSNGGTLDAATDATIKNLTVADGATFTTVGGQTFTTAGDVRFSQGGDIDANLEGGANATLTVDTNAAAFKGTVGATTTYKTVTVGVDGTSFEGALKGTNVSFNGNTELQNGVVSDNITVAAGKTLETTTNVQNLGAADKVLNLNGTLKTSIGTTVKSNVVAGENSALDIRAATTFEGTVGSSSQAVKTLTNAETVEIEKEAFIDQANAGEALTFHKAAVVDTLTNDAAHAHEFKANATVNHLVFANYDSEIKFTGDDSVVTLKDYSMTGGADVGKLTFNGKNITVKGSFDSLSSGRKIDDYAVTNTITFEDFKVVTNTFAVSDNANDKVLTFAKGAEFKNFNNTSTKAVALSLGADSNLGTIVPADTTSVEIDGDHTVTAKVAANGKMSAVTTTTDKQGKLAVEIADGQSLEITAVGASDKVVKELHNTSTGTYKFTDALHATSVTASKNNEGKVLVTLSKNAEIATNFGEAEKVFNDVEFVNSGYNLTYTGTLNATNAKFGSTNNTQTVALKGAINTKTGTLTLDQAKFTADNTLTAKDLTMTNAATLVANKDVNVSNKATLANELTVASNFTTKDLAAAATVLKLNDGANFKYTGTLNSQLGDVTVAEGAKASFTGVLDADAANITVGKNATFTQAGDITTTGNLVFAEGSTTVYGADSVLTGGGSTKIEKNAVQNIGTHTVTLANDVTVGENVKLVIGANDAANISGTFDVNKKTLTNNDKALQVEFNGARANTDYVIATNTGFTAESKDDEVAKKFVISGENLLFAKRSLSTNDEGQLVFNNGDITSGSKLVGSRVAASTGAFADQLTANYDKANTAFRTALNAAAVDADKVAEVVNGEAPSQVRAASAVSLDSSARAVNFAQARSNPTAAAAGEANIEHGVWVEGFGAKGQQNKRKGVAGYDMEAYGVNLGADMMFDEVNMFGLALNYTDTQVKHKHYKKGDKTTAQTYQATAYAAHQLPNNLHLSEYLNVGNTKVKNKAHRYLAGKEVAKSKTDALHYALGAKLAYNHHVDASTVSPYLSVDYAKSLQGGYTETGTTLENQTVTKGDRDVFLGGLGVSLAHRMDMGGYTVTPEVHAGMKYDFIGKADKVKLDMAGMTGLEYKAPKPERLSYNVGASVNMVSGDTYSVKLRYEGNFKSDYNAHEGALKLRVNL